MLKHGTKIKRHSGCHQSAFSVIRCCGCKSRWSPLCSILMHAPPSASFECWSGKVFLDWTVFVQPWSGSPASDMNHQLLQQLRLRDAVMVVAASGQHAQRQPTAKSDLWQE
eukprot:TRINITY_DN44292_c0_g1_i1.p2 TRINITY_DN44292_c0_g1~~TRINITY_DN44292_c0_g1_i1.p2  ORF type:complete len:111 (+),score=16.59 TRINITY_DN44292_c0_g1_i1:262-594(+)